MSFFKQREPRRFQHNYIYYDERKEKLRKIEEKAKRELGLLPKKEFDPEDIRGKFVEQTTHLKRFKEGREEGNGRRLSAFGIFMIIIALLLIWRFLLN